VWRSPLPCADTFRAWSGPCAERSLAGVCSTLGGMGCAASLAFRTVDDGDACAVTTRTGRVHVADGPSMLLRCGRSFRSLDRHVAGEDESPLQAAGVTAGPRRYLVVQFRDGRTELVPGPASVFEHPVPAGRLRSRGTRRCSGAAGSWERQAFGGHCARP
jgi:hypothetical protein